MIQPLSINNSVKSNIAPVPKPPKAVSFTGLKSFCTHAQQAKNSANNFLIQKAFPFIKKTFNKIKAQTPKAEKYSQAIIDKTSKYFGSIKKVVSGTNKKLLNAVEKFIKS